MSGQHGAETGYVRKNSDLIVREPGLSQGVASANGGPTNGAVRKPRLCLAITKTFSLELLWIRDNFRMQNQFLWIQFCINAYMPSTLRQFFCMPAAQTCAVCSSYITVFLEFRRSISSSAVRSYPDYFYRDIFSICVTYLTRTLVPTTCGITQCHT